MEILTFEPTPEIERRLCFEALPAAQQAIAEAYRRHIQQAMRVAPSGRGSVGLAIADPLNCLLATVAAYDLGHDVFLCDPQWPQRNRLLREIAPVSDAKDGDWDGGEWNEQGEVAAIAPRNWAELADRANREPYIAIPTGGTTGQRRFACHTWQTLTASACGVRAAFQRDRLDSLCCLPTFHVSGLSQFVRAIVSGGRLAIASPGSIRPDRSLPAADFSSFWLSLVPTQLQRLLEVADWRDWLQQFDAIFLGGAPAWPELLDRARTEGLRLAPTFGMTETASQIATLHPDDFLAGRTGCGRAVPHAEIAIEPVGDDESRNGETGDGKTGDGETGKIGAIAIRAASLCHGYYDPATDMARPLTTERYWRSDDLGYLDRSGILHVIGRASQKLISGGENVYPEAVEAAIRATGLVADVAVCGLPDREWGQVLAAVYVLPRASQKDSSDPRALSRDVAAQIRDRLTSCLARYEIPKRWRQVAALPRNDRGKLNRAALPRLF